MKPLLAVVALPLFVAIAAAPAFAQAPKQAPKKPPVKAAPKTPAKAPAAAKPEPPPPPPPDIAISAAYVTGDKTTKGTILMHGARQRMSSESSIVSIYQGDTHRPLQLNNDTHVYLITPDPAATPEAPAAPAGGK